MQVIDLTNALCPLYLRCLEERSEELAEAEEHRTRWYASFRDRGLRVKLARNDQDGVIGMIQYMPADEAFVDARDLYFVLCLRVLAREGGDRPRRGVGSALLEAAEADVRTRGARGIAAWGVARPPGLRASWFRRRGYSRADTDGRRVLLWKSFSDDAVPPAGSAAGTPRRRDTDTAASASPRSATAGAPSTTSPSTGHAASPRTSATRWSSNTWTPPTPPPSTTGARSTASSSTACPYAPCRPLPIGSCTPAWRGQCAGRAARSEGPILDPGSGICDRRPTTARVYSTTMTSRVRGPCTPSTRFNSMSDVADGPDTRVIGRCSARTRSRSSSNASGNRPRINEARTTQRW